MRYGHVTNGTIDKGPCSLPKSWENISGLNNMSDEQLLAFGWLPWTFVTVPVGSNQVLNGSTIKVNATEIVETQIVRNLTPGEIAGQDQREKDNNKAIASELLYKTDWTTIPDVSNSEMSSPYLVNVAEFIEYRNTIRKIAVNPTANAVFPDTPVAIWGN